VIVRVGDRWTSQSAAGERVRTFTGIDRSARLKLDRPEAATSLQDLAALPGNRFEALPGGRKGRHSIPSSDLWRICIEWPGRAPGPSNVAIVDYR
jgi:proteic killer suppression protein